MKRRVLVPALLIAAGAVGLGLYATRDALFAAPLAIAPHSATTSGSNVGGMLRHGSSIPMQNSVRVSSHSGPATMVTPQSGDERNESHNSTTWNGGMGAASTSMMGRYSIEAETSTITKANRDMSTSLTHATVNKTNNTNTYSGDNVRIVIFGGAMDDDTAGPAEKFVIGGLVNPTLHVQQGAKVNFEFVNEDTDMPHGIEVSSAQPPYRYMTMMTGGIYPGSVIAPIPEASGNSLSVASATFSVSQPGTFYYLCQYPGHAAEGMYGKIVVG